MTDDFELLQRWRDGDPNAGIRLVRGYYGLLYRFFATKVARSDLDDFIQRTLIVCVEKRDTMPIASVTAYVVGVARKLLWDERRRSAREARAMRIEGAGGVAIFDSPAERLDSQRDRRLMLVALHELPLDLQILVELYYWENASTTDLAAILEVPRGTIKSRLFRARRLLKDALAAHEADDTVLGRSAGEGLEVWAQRIQRVCPQRIPQRVTGPLPV